MHKRKEDSNPLEADGEQSSSDELDSGSKTKVSHKKKELLSQLQRVRADYANYQKRMARDAEETRQWARAEIVKSILPAVDDFEQALEAGKTAKDVQSLLEGFNLVHDHLLNMLTQQQVEPIATEGERFDPVVHEAMLQQESSEHEPGTVMAELRKGYMMNGRTLRPARVIVSKSPSEEEASEGEGAEQGSDGQDNGQ